MQDVLQKLSFTAAGQLNPMAAMFGGVVGQEVMKAASGKFHPLFQFFYFDSIESLPDDPLSPEDVAPQVCNECVRLIQRNASTSSRLLAVLYVRDRPDFLSKIDQVRKHTFCVTCDSSD